MLYFAKVMQFEVWPGVAGHIALENSVTFDPNYFKVCELELFVTQHSGEVEY